MPELSSESYSTSTGKRGRPKTLDDRAPRELRDQAEVTAEASNSPEPETRPAMHPDYVPPPGLESQVKAATLKPNSGPPCPYCARPTERSTKLLRAYGLNALRCLPCRTVSIQDDGGYWFDLVTAASGVLLRRAAVIHEIKSAHIPPPNPSKVDVSHDILTSDWDDPRWSDVRDIR